MSLPPFLKSLTDMLCDPASCLSWDADGESFIVRSMPPFPNEVLPLYFRHSQYVSFVRQLNIYGFRKTSDDGASRRWRRQRREAKADEGVGGGGSGCGGGFLRPTPHPTPPPPTSSPPAGNGTHQFKHPFFRRHMSADDMASIKRREVGAPELPRTASPPWPLCPDRYLVGQSRERMPAPPA